MRKTSPVFALQLAACAAVCLSFTAFAYEQVGSYRLAPSNTLDSELWLSCADATLAGTVTDDAFVVAGFGSAVDTNAGQVLLSGSVGGDFWALASTVLVNGAVRQHARLAGRVVRFDGEAGQGLFAAAGSVALGSNSLVTGRAHLIGNYVIAQGRVAGNLYAEARKVVLDGQVQGSAYIDADEIIVTPGTHIVGDLVYTAPQELVLNRAAHIDGKLTRRIVPPVPAGPRMLTELLLFVGSAFVGLMFLRAAPRTAGVASAFVRESHAKCLLVGGIALIAVPFVVLASLFSVVGLPFGLILGACYLVVGYLGRFVCAVAVGRLALRQSHDRQSPAGAGAMLLGLAVLYLATSAPFGVGVIVWLWTVMSGMGAIIIASRTRDLWVLTPAEPPTPEAEQKN